MLIQVVLSLSWVDEVIYAVSSFVPRQVLASHPKCFLFLFRSLLDSGVLYTCIVSLILFFYTFFIINLLLK